MIHRSKAAREICKKAENIALADESSNWRGAHLLKALLESPTKELTEILKESGIIGFEVAINTPVLNNYGRDLTASIREAKINGHKIQDSEILKEPVCKIVLSDLLEGKRKIILLIQKGKRKPKEVVECIAGYFVGDSAPSAAKNKRIVEIDWLGMDWVERRYPPSDILSYIFQEVLESKNIILFLNNFQQFIDGKLPPHIDPFIKLFKKHFTEEGIQCIAGIDEKNYNKHVKIDPNLKGLLTPVWIHALEMPLQL